MKKFTVLGVAALVLAMVSSAFAATEWPYQSMNKTWSVIGFSVNGTTLAGSPQHWPAASLNSTGFKGSAVVAPTAGGGWATFQNHYNSGAGLYLGNMTQNGTTLGVLGAEFGYNATRSNIYNSGAGTVLVNQNGPNAQPRGLMTVGVNNTAYNTIHAGGANASVRFYLLPVSGYNLMFGLSFNSTGKMLGNTHFNSTATRYGASFLAFQGRDFADTTTGANTTLDIKNTNLGIAGASTWSFFAVAPGAPMIGTIQFNASSSGTLVKYLNGTTQKPGNYSLIVDSRYKKFGLKKSSISPFENATLTTDNSTFIGFSRNGTFVIGLKNAVQGSTSDYYNRYFNVLGVGYTSTNGAAKGNRSFAMLGGVQVNSAGYIVSGNVTTQNGTAIGISRYSNTRASSSSNQVRLASVSKLNGVSLYRSYDNVTISNNTVGAGSNSSYVVVWEKNKKFALGLSQFNPNTKQAALLILLPKFATEGSFEAQNGPDGSVTSTPALYNRYGAIGSQWSNYEVVKRRFGTQLNGFTPVGSVRSFNSTVTTQGTSGRNYTQYRYSLSNWGGDVSTLRLKKLILKGSSSMFSGQTADTVLDFSYSTAGSTATDGIWWVSAGSNVVQPGQIIDTNDGTATYYVNFVIRDNGPYDGNKTSKYVTDPQILGTVVPGGSSSSSSTGCVFNPTAGFGLEWLLLLIAPALGIIRSRLKK
jgi:hypothetical protein